MVGFKSSTWIGLFSLISLSSAYDPTSGTSLLQDSLNHNLYPRSAQGASPVQHRLAFHGETGMTISWNTYQQLQEPTVKFGLTPNTLFLSQKSDVTSSITYPTSRTWNNHVTLEGLIPNTKYYYQVSNANASQIYSFKTPKVKGDRTAFNMAVVVDMGLFGSDGLGTTVGKGAANPLQPGEINTIQRLTSTKDDYEFVVHPGDFAYSDYWLKEVVQGYLPGNISAGPELYEKLNEEFYDELESISSEKAYMSGAGNHEANCDNSGYKQYTESICPVGQTNFTGYINRFRMPSDLSGGEGNFWYSFDYGFVHYVIFDTETDLGTGRVGAEEPRGSSGAHDGPFGATMNSQLDFLEKDLASVDRFLTPWVIALGHRPWYVNGGACIQCQQAFEPIFIKHNVDVVFSGHVHNYQRQTPIKNNVTDPNGLNNPSSPLYILNGAAGHYDGLDALPAGPLQNFTRFANDTLYGYSKVQFHNVTHLTHQFISSASGQVIDEATLYKQRSSPF